MRCRSKAGHNIEVHPTTERGSTPTPLRREPPLYRGRKLLAMAAERLDDQGTKKLRGLLAAGDPDGQVYEAWAVKEGLRDLYTLWGRPRRSRGSGW